MPLDRYDKMDDAKFLETLLKALGGKDRAKMVINKELLIVDKRLFVSTRDCIKLAPVERFSARESFRVGEHDGLKIAYVGNRFARLFLDVVEHGVKESEVRRLILRKRTSTVRMLPDLGKRKYACIPLAHVYAFLKLANEGSRDYLFFAASVQRGTMWPIMADRSPDGWNIECSEHIRGTKRFDPGRVVVPHYRD